MATAMAKASFSVNRRRKTDVNSIADIMSVTKHSKMA